MNYGFLKMNLAIILGKFSKIIFEKDKPQRKYSLNKILPSKLIEFPRDYMIHETI